MKDHDRIRSIVERDIYRRMNQLGGTLYSYSIQGVDPYEDLVTAVHNELTDEDIDHGREIMEWWLVSDHLGERLRDTGFMVMETVDGWFYGRTTAGVSLDHDINTMLYKEEIAERDRVKKWKAGHKDLGMEYPDHPDHEDPLHTEQETSDG